MAKLAEVRSILWRLNTVLEGRWQPMFWKHVEFLMYFFERDVSEENGGISWRWEAMLGPEVALGDTLELELGPKSERILKELQRWLNMSAYASELNIPWEPPPKARSCS